MIERQRKIILVSLFAALTAIGSFIKIPFPYVPLTLQTLFVILSGDILGPKYAAYSQILFLLLGLIGLPVFAYGGGIGYVVQPSFGYLLAYPFGAYVIGKLMSKSKEYTKRYFFITTSIINFIGILVIFTIGVLYLYLNLKYIVGEDIGIHKALWSGFIVFIPGDILKVLLASWLTIKLKAYMNTY